MDASLPTGGIADEARISHIFKNAPHMISNTLEKLIADGLVKREDIEQEEAEAEKKRKEMIQKVDQLKPALDFLGDFPHVRKSGWGDRLQGVTHDADHWYFTQTNYLWKIPVAKSLELFIDRVKWHGPIPVRQPLEEVARQMGLMTRRLPLVLEKEGYSHLGDLTCHRGKLLVPVEGGPRPLITVFDTELKYLGCFHLPKVQDSAPWCAVNPEDGLLYSSNTHTDYFCKYSVPWDALDQISPNLHQSLDMTVENALKIDYVGSLELSDEEGSPLVLRVVQGATFSNHGLLFTLNGYCQVSTLFEDEEAFERWKTSGQLWMDITGLSVFNAYSGRRIAKSVNEKGLGGFRFEFHPHNDRAAKWSQDRWNCPDRAEKPEGLTYWDLDEVEEKHEGVSGQLHAILQCFDGGVDDVFFKHYHVQV